MSKLAAPLDREIPLVDVRAAIRSALGERYDILTHLGTGGMAEVYLARDLRQPREVALKVIRQELAAAVGADRFLREISITSRLSHPHIRPLLDSGEIDSILYYAMPFHRGETLRERLKRDDSLGLDEALRITRDLADALDYAHSESIVHRDVKPGNIFIDAGNAVLSDFGIAIAAGTADTERLTDSGVVIGTAEYLSPEQCVGSERVDGRADIYALGCVLYEMLTGQPPFTGRTRAAVIAKHMGVAAPSAAILRPDLPIEVDELLQRCLAKTPGDRWSTAGDLRDAIDEARSRIRTGSSRGPATAIRIRRRTRTRVAGAAAAIAVAAVAGILWFARPTLPPVDANKVIFFPLADRGGGGDAGSAAAMMIGNALIHADPLRPIDAWDYLTAEQRNDPATSLTWREARGIARDRGAAYAIMGGITRTADSTTVRLTLHDVSADEPIDDGSYTAASAVLGPEQVGVRALVQLLPAMVGTDNDIDMSLLTDRDPGAVFLWIRGDLEYRSARFTAALDLYRDAVREDSLVVFAALKGAQAASWAEQPELAVELARHAAANDSLLPPRFRSFTSGLLSYLEGRADDAVAAYGAALEEDPEWAEAWMALGEVYQHLFPSDLRQGVSAPAAFENAVRFDPSFAPALVHLSEYSIRRGDAGHAMELVTRLRESGAEGAARLAATALFMSCAASGPDPALWRDAVERDFVVVLEAAHQLAVGAAFTDCAEQAFRMALEHPEIRSNWRWHATIGLQSVLVARGRDAEAAALIDETRATLSAALLLPALDVLAGAGLHGAAERTDSIADANFGPTYESPNLLTAWLVGTWKAYAEDRVGLAPIRDRLNAAARAGTDPAATRMASSIEARWRLMSGDTTGAIERLRSLRVSGTRAELLTSLDNAFPAERLLLAELLLKRNEPEEAYWTAAVLDHAQPLLFTAFVPRSLAVRYEAASNLPGSVWRRRADDARRRLEDLGRADLLPTR